MKHITVNRIALFLAVFVHFSNQAYAQLSGERLSRHEVSLGTGSASIYMIGASLFANGSVSSRQLCARYRYIKSGELAFGVSASMENVRRTDHYDLKVYTLMPEVTWVYFGNILTTKRFVRLYGTCAAGLAWYREDDGSQSYPADGYERTRLTTATFHLSPLGIRLGRSFGIYGEFGFGCKGIVSGGIDYHFR